MRAVPAAGSFASFIGRRHADGRLVLQPRMGFGTPGAMRAGLQAVKDADAVTVGTITLDSYTRVGDHLAAARALREGADLNGFPIVAHGVEVTKAVLAGIAGPDFPVQVRHGTALPREVIGALLACGIDATEGGPVSYCLPYSRVPLALAAREWAESCRLMASYESESCTPHLESFGGCMLGQLCPPELLIAITVLEGLFFKQFGLRSVSLSYAQQTSPSQDLEAVLALRRLANEFLADVDWHVVIYTYMGVFPSSPGGAARVLDDSVRLAVIAGAERLIVKTMAEFSRIPTVEENVAALEAADRAARRHAAALPPEPLGTMRDSETYRGARTLVEAVLNLSSNLETAVVSAFEKGVLDVPYCLHTDNRNEARAWIDSDGWLRWADVGRMPLPSASASRARVGSEELLSMLSYVARRADMEHGSEGSPVGPMPSDGTE